MDIENMENTLLEFGIATEDEINIVSNINGYSVESMEAILYAKTGYRDIYQLLEELED